MMKTVCMLLFLVACTGDRAFLLDDGFSPEEAAAIQRAADKWAEATGREWTLTPAPLECATDGSVSRCGPGELDRLGPWNSACASHNRQAVMLAPQWVPPGLLEAYTLHEFGHTLGLGHAPYGVMRQGNDRAWIDAQTREDACALVGCL